MSDIELTPEQIAARMTPGRRKAMLAMPDDAVWPYDKMDPAYRVPFFMQGLLFQIKGPDLLMRWSKIGRDTRACLGGIV